MYCAGHYPLDRGCDCCCGDWSLHWMLGRASPFLCGCHNPVGGRVCSPFVGVEALRVGFNKVLLPLSVCPLTKEVSAEASETCVVTANLRATHAGICGSAQKQPKFAGLSPLCSSQI